MPSVRAWTLPVAVAAIATLDAAAAIELRVVSEGLPQAGLKHPVWSRDGRAIAAMAGPWDPLDVHVVLVGFDLEGNLLQWPPAGIGGWEADRPTFDPSQSRVAFSGWVDLVGRGLMVTEITGPLTLVPVLVQEDAGYPAWSPDGSRILIETTTGLQSADVSGGPPQQVTMRSDDKTPAWSPDGSQVVFSSTLGGTRDLWIRDLGSRRLHRLTADAAEDGWPSWSPNGAWIAFASDRGGTADIWAVRVTGGAPVLIAGLPADDIAPAWSPDGATIAFQSGAAIWVATDLPDYILAVEPASWSRVKTLYRDAVR